ncbi:MAG: hypothetical protein ABIP94_05815 [Planctomycetota bacterium]
MQTFSLCFRCLPLASMALLWMPLQLSTPLAAQGRDPMHEIQEIARNVDEQLQEIDRLLLESGRKNQTRSRPKELLQKAREQSDSVEGGIDQLIEKLTQMKNQSSSSSSQSQQQQQPRDGQGQPKPGQGQGQQNRRENQTPDFVQQPKEGEGQQPGEEGQPQPQGQKPEGQKPEGQQPQGAQEAPGPGQNTTGNRPPESEIGPGQPGKGEGSWGELQPYLNAIKNRGSAPKVPEKYRKYWEAYLKNSKEGGGK